MKHNIKRALGEHSMRVAVHAVAQDTDSLEEQEPPEWLPVSNRDSQSIVSFRKGSTFLSKA